jgi:hypothetical protein
LEALDKHYGDCGEHGKYKNNEVAMIVCTDTVIYPGAVMIKTLNAAIAN